MDSVMGRGAHVPCMTRVTIKRVTSIMHNERPTVRSLSKCNPVCMCYVQGKAECEETAQGPWGRPGVGRCSSGWGLSGARPYFTVLVGSR